MRRLTSSLCLVALLAGCGGGDGGSSGGSATGVAPAPTPSPTPTAVAGCSLRERQLWVAGELREWYLFPEALPANLDPAGYGSVSDYVDALTATARAQSKDRYFTYVTSIAEENAYYGSGASAGFGFRLGFDVGAARVFVIEAFEDAPALAAGLDRGTEIISIGASGGTLRSVSSLVASGGPQAVSEALGPDVAGDMRVMRVRAPDGAERNVTLAVAGHELLEFLTRESGAPL